MKKIIFALFAFVLFSSHVMYLKLNSYFLEPNTSATIHLFNGTFEKSENSIDRNRMLDASLMGNGERLKVNTTQWTEKDSVTLLNFTTGDSGTWVAAISTAPRSIEMTAAAFNTYLEHEGILDMLDWRRENDQHRVDAVEKYSKHVKTIFQVGDKRSNDWEKALGYPIEFIPLNNPYDLNTGDSLRIKLLLNGEPLANQLVYADYKAPANGHTHEDEDGQDGNAEHGHPHEDVEASTEQEHTHENAKTADHSHDDTTEKGHSHAEGTKQDHAHEEKDNPKAAHSHDTISHQHSEAETLENEHSHDNASEHSHGEAAAHNHEANDAKEAHQHTSGQQLRTDVNGIVTAKLTADGIWYLQTIHMVNTEEKGFTHESNWTTLTFEVAHGHGEDTHSHEHETEEGIPSYLYWIGSFLLVGILFFWFNRKN